MRIFPIITAAALLLSGCGGGHHASADATPTAAPSPTYDGSTIGACKEAAHATDPGDEGTRHAQAARGFAELSDVPALREVAKKFTDTTDLDQVRDEVRATTAAITISTWCLQHGVDVE